MSPRITALAADPRTAAEFWRSVEAGGTPLVEPLDDGHAAVTFLWRGTEETRAVLALPNKVIDPADPAPNLMSLVPGTDVWHVTLRMRTDWRASYALCVDDGRAPRPDPAGPGYAVWLRGQVRRDPLNPRTLPRRWGGEHLSVVTLPDAPDQADWQPRDGAPRGGVTLHQVASRPVRVYEPPGRDHTDLPVLVLFDGEMWEPGLGLSSLLDNLIADGRIPPLIALLPDSRDSGTRWAELACDKDFADMLAGELLPWAAGRWPVTADPARTVLAGQSLGGLMSAYAALRAPERFGNVLSQSGSFWWPDGPDAQWLTSRIAGLPRHDVRFHLSAGLQEWVLLPANRRFRDTLRARGYDVTYREVNGGHDYLWWRDELAEGLVALLGPPSPPVRRRVPPHGNGPCPPLPGGRTA